MGHGRWSAPVEARTIFENLKRACTELDVGFNQLMLVRVYSSDSTKFGEFKVVGMNILMTVQQAAATGNTFSLRTRWAVGATNAGSYET